MTLNQQEKTHIDLISLRGENENLQISVLLKKNLKEGN